MKSIQSVTRNKEGIKTNVIVFLVTAVIMFATGLVAGIKLNDLVQTKAEALVQTMADDKTSK